MTTGLAAFTVSSRCAPVAVKANDSTDGVGAMAAAATAFAACDAAAADQVAAVGGRWISLKRGRSSPICVVDSVSRKLATAL